MKKDKFRSDPTFLIFLGCGRDRLCPFNSCFSLQAVFKYYGSVSFFITRKTYLLCTSLCHYFDIPTSSFLSRQSLESLEECNSSLSCNVINPWISQNMMQTDPDPVLNAVLACACSVRYLTTVSNWSGHPDFVTSFYNCSSLSNSILWSSEDM